MQTALSLNDGTTAIVMYREFVDAKWFSDRRKFPTDQRISVYSGLSGNTPIEQLRKLLQGTEAQWAKEKHQYPPWWMWWNGFHR
jgi:hypothetical protein